MALIDRGSLFGLVLPAAGVTGRVLCHRRLFVIDAARTRVLGSGLKDPERAIAEFVPELRAVPADLAAVEEQMGL